MTAALLSLSEALAALGPLAPVEPRPVPLDEAIGLAVAADILAQVDFPEAAIALRPGYAVSALDLAGASPHSPVPLAAEPALLAPGDLLPPGMDALLDPEWLQRDGPMLSAMQAGEPGAGVRLAGHDLAAGQPVVAAGALVTAEAALALAVAGIRHVSVRHPCVRLDWPDGPERRWLARRLAAFGARPANAEDRIDLVLRAETGSEARLALKPGETAWAARESGLPILMLPARFDGLIGAWCGLATPMLAELAGRILRGTLLPLSRKLASAVGISEVALLQIEAGLAHPLGIGDLSLDAIAAADAYAILPAASEGLAAGDTIEAIHFNAPFGHAGVFR
jgi:molybdopterin biosynthesis enzyme